jgi:hypothetical protein
MVMKANKFQKINRLLLAMSLLLSLGSAAIAAATSSGLDTLLDDQVFAVKGQAIGDWNTSGLSVKGYVQIGQTTAVCVPAIEGALQYVPTAGTVAGHYLYCDGAVWKSLTPQTFNNPSCGGYACYYGYGGTMDGSVVGSMTAWCQQQGYTTYITASSTGGGCDSCTYGGWSGGWRPVQGPNCNGCTQVGSVTCQ